MLAYVGASSVVRKKSFNKKEWMLTRERFQLIDEEPPTDTPFVSVQNVLADIFKKIEANRQPWFGEVHAEWDSLLGDLTSRHARPVGMRGRTLIVHVDNSAWLNELVRFRRGEMLERLQRKFGSERIQNISLRLEPESAG